MSLDLVTLRRNAQSLVLAFALALIAAPQSAQATRIFEFELIDQPETDGSWIRPNDGSIEFYPGGTVLSLELPDGLVTGPATLSMLSYTQPTNSIGIFFQILAAQSPTSISGTFTRVGNEGQLDFDNVMLRFERGNNPSSTQEGTLTFNLTTGTQTIAAGCDGQGSSRMVSGTPIDIALLQSTGEANLGLIGSVCPYNDDISSPGQYNEAFRWSLQGTVPEPGTGLLLGLGLSVLAVRGRKRATSR